MSDAVSPLSAALADPGTSAGARILHAALVEPRRRGAVLRLATTARGDPPPHRSADRGAAARLGAAGGSPCPAGGSRGAPVGHAVIWRDLPSVNPNREVAPDDQPLSGWRP